MKAEFSPKVVKKKRKRKSHQMSHINDTQSRGEHTHSLDLCSQALAFQITRLNE